jgi:hypothetical protein
VTVTSEWLAELAGKKNQNVVIVRNAVEYSHFAIRPERISRIRGPPHHWLLRCNRGLV